MKTNVAAVTMHPGGAGFLASVSIAEFLISQRDLESALEGAAHEYGSAINSMRNQVTQIAQLRAQRQLTPARSIWLLGDSIFVLVDTLSARSIELDDLYSHLSRDLGVKRKWLEKVIILRRYIPVLELIPPGLNWGSLEKGTRRHAQELSHSQES